MTVAEMITAARLKVEDTFIDTGVIVRASDAAPVTNPVTFVSTRPDPTTVYDGRCRVKKPSTEEQTEIWGDTEVSVQRRILRLPHDAPEVRVDDVFTASSSDDPEVLRQHMRVSVVVAGSMNFYRDFGVEVVE